VKFEIFDLRSPDTRRRSRPLIEKRVASGGIKDDIEFVCRQPTKDKGGKFISFVLSRKFDFCL
jgi:hypothetical protein